MLKNQSIKTINFKNNPNEPSAWFVQEAKHNIGCISKTGSLVWNDTLYTCWYDGIYQLSLNNMSPSDQTPTEMLRISEPINDKYLALSLANKKLIKLGIDQYKNELIIVGL